MGDLAITTLVSGIQHLDTAFASSFLLIVFNLGVYS